MTPSDRAELLDWLRENCLHDGELQELIDLLDRQGRDDLLFLMRCFRPPPYRLDAEIADLVGSAEAVERGLVELEAIYYRPIGQRHHERREQQARRDRPVAYYRNRLMTGHERCEALVEDPAWDIPDEAREKLRVLLACAREKKPVPFEGLAARLELSTTDEVIDLLTVLHARVNEQRRAREKGSRNDRGGRQRP